MNSTHVQPELEATRFVHLNEAAVLGMGPGTNHGFHNDTGPRCTRAASGDAWASTPDFFDISLRV